DVARRWRPDRLPQLTPEPRRRGQGRLRAARAWLSSGAGCWPAGPAKATATSQGARSPMSSSRTTARASAPDQITYPQIRPDLRAHIKSIVITEFGGIAPSPTTPQALLTFEP